MARLLEFKVIDVPPSNVKDRKVQIIGYERLVDGVWCYMDYDDYHGGGDPQWYAGTYSGLFWLRCQFTSKVDKNENYIYEGDILTNGKHFAEVRWVGEWVAINEKEDFVWNPEEFDQLELAGNIYQNPELMK